MQRRSDYSDFSFAPFILTLLCLIPLFIFASFADWLKGITLNRCYKKYFSLDNCPEKPCFMACTGLQNAKYDAALQKRAKKGDQEAILALEFNAYYG